MTVITYYSDHYSRDGDMRTIDEGSHGADDINGAPLRVAIGKCDLTAVGASLSDGDVVRMARIRSRNRVVELRFSTDGQFDGGTSPLAYIGFHKKGANHDGAIVDAEIFSGSGGDITIDPTNGAYQDFNVTTDDVAGGSIELAGKRCWEHAADAGVALTQDPKEEWDLTVSPTDIAGNTTSGKLVVAMFYT